MKKFKCTICGYIYDELKGIPEKGIEPGTRWVDLPDDWKCPWCGAPKAMFKEITEDVKEEVVIQNEDKEEIVASHDDTEKLREVSYGELSAICSNLSKGCKKQYLEQEGNLFDELSHYFKSKETINNNDNSYDDLISKINSDLEKEYPIIKKLCLEKKDRATLRAITWGEKSTLILKSLLERYKKEGSAFLENTNVYVCDICGFIYVGNSVPEVCPICKVPSLKILQVRGV
ncbi:MAG: rubredoxin [Bacilli bacterium]